MYKILIVDDEALERKALRCIIQECIPKITSFHEASDGQEAIEKARELKPHIMIMDIKMPRVDGIEASRQIREFLPNCRIILLSGYTYFSYAREAVSIGIHDFMVKPIGDDELVASIQSIVDSLERERNSVSPQVGEKMKDLYNCLEGEFVSSLAFRKMEDPQLSKYLEALEVGSGYFLGVIFNPQGEEPLGPDHERYIREIGNQVFDRDRILTIKIERQVYFLLVLKDFRANLILKKQLKDFVVQLDLTTPLSLNACVGSIKTTPQEIFETFNEARMVPPSEDRVSFYQWTLSPNEKQFPINEEEKLCERLMTGDREAALALLGNIYRWIDKNSVGFGEFRIRVYDLLVVLNRRVRRELDPGDSIIYHSKIDSLGSRDEVKAYLIDELQNLLDSINTHYSTSSKVWKRHIINYIEKNYRNAISLEELAEIAGFSAPYLSRIFKKEFGMNFSSYVNHLRVKEAKTLLVSSELSIKEISYELGFSDSNYFARVFKKETGINASQYQKSPNLTK